MLKSVRSKTGLLVGMGILLMSNVSVAQEYPPSEEHGGETIPFSEEPNYPAQQPMEMPVPTFSVTGCPGCGKRPHESYRDNGKADGVARKSVSQTRSECKVY